MWKLTTMYASEPTRGPASGLLEAALVKEISMIIGGGLLGTILVIALIVYFLRRT
jgi:hypothetical protein